MGERSILEIAEALDKGFPVSSITLIPGTVYKTKEMPKGEVLPSYEQLCENKKAYADSFRIQYENTDAFSGKVLIESYGNRGFVVQNPPSKPSSQKEMDEVYDLPTQELTILCMKSREKFLQSKKLNLVLPVVEAVLEDVISGDLAFHQGRIVQTRSHASIIEEAKSYVTEKDFKGYIHDVGPTADFRHPSCKKQETKGVCTNKQCLFPKPCKNLEVDHKDYLELLRKLRNVSGVKKVFIRSGIRFDYVNADASSVFLEELAKYHVSGQLRVAPEHISDEVLYYMGKPEHAVYQQFLKMFEKANAKSGKKQYVVPYLMSSHPGCTIKEAVKLAEYVRNMGFTPEQVQDFYPTPSTMSTCMYYTGIDPRTGKKVYVPKTTKEKSMQRALLQYKNPENYELVKEALLLAGRKDLIGFDKKCLIRPRGMAKKEQGGKKPVAKKKKSIRNVHKRKG